MRNMKKRSVLMMMVLLLMQTITVWARPGYKVPVNVQQPDGTTVALVMQGDEFHSFMTTTDGYTVIKGDDGYYRYAVKQGDDLKASPFVAKDAERRQADEQAFLAGSQKMISAKMSETGKQWRERASKMYSAAYANLQDGGRRAITPGALSERIDYSKFKGLVVLVNWSDRSFKIQNPADFYSKLTNQKNYTDNSKSLYPYNVKGSVRDYFYDNSMGVFDPTFDVTGPVTIDISCEYPWPKDASGNVRSGWDSRICTILKAIMAKIDDQVDFKNYDLDNDGVIDMVYIIFAGYGSYVSGNNMKYMWPHAGSGSDIYTTNGIIYRDYFKFPSYDGKKFGRYACSMEIQDLESDAAQHAYPDGIGTMCHEFSHVLGLADHYDTDYEQNGEATTPMLYDVMDNGADINQGLSPVGYSAFERYVLGFADQTVTTLDVAGKYTLEPLNTSNKGYIVKAAKNGEVFYVENRQKQGWDESLPKHGLLLWRVDLSDTKKFISNNVNNVKGDERLQIVDGAPFTDIDLTAATNTTWGSKGAVIDLYDITTNDGVISFEAGKDVYTSIVEDFESTPLAETGATGLAGKFCTWSLNNASIIANTESYGNGQHVACLNKGGTITSSVIDKQIRTLKFTLKNSATSAIRFYLRTSTDGGKTWANYPTTTSYAVVQKSQSRNLSFTKIPANSQIQLAVTTNSASAGAAACYVDDIAITYDKEGSTGIEGIKASQRQQNSAIYNLAGQRVDSAYKGLVIKDGKKVLVK